MSHFQSIATKLVDRDCLVAGLREVFEQIGITNPEIEVHDRPQLLENSYASSDRAYANIIVRRRSIPRPEWRDGLSAIDIGFLQTEDGYQAVIDPWDIERSQIGLHYQASSNTQAFLNALQVAHNKAFVQQTYADWEMADWETLADGSIQMTVTQPIRLASL